MGEQYEERHRMCQGRGGELRRLEVARPGGSSSWGTQGLSGKEWLQLGAAEAEFHQSRGCQEVGVGDRDLLGHLVGLPGRLYQGTVSWVARTTDIYFLTALEAASPRSRCLQGWSLLSLLGV